MNYAYWLMLLAQGSSGGNGGGQGEASGPSPWLCVLFAVGLMVIWYFIFIRPKQKEQQERQEMLDALEKNDEVITVGGMKGKVANIGEDYVTLKVDDNKNVKMKFQRQAVRQNLTKEEEEDEDENEDGGPANSDS